jgi:hypothetical protein
VVSAVLPSNRWTSSGNPDGSTSSPTWAWGPGPVLLAQPDLAQPVRAGVLVAGLEMPRGAVIKHQRRQAARGSGERRAGLRDPVPVAVALAALQRPEQRPQRRRRRAEIGQHAQTVRLGGRLDDPGQHHRTERLIGQHLQPKPGVRVRQHLPQQLRGRRDHAAGGVHRDRAPRQPMPRARRPPAWPAPPGGSRSSPRRRRSAAPPSPGPPDPARPDPARAAHEPSTTAAPSASVWADPRCSTRSICRPRRVTTCTATAPDDVRTLRTNRETTPECFHAEVIQPRPSLCLVRVACTRPSAT